MRQMVDGKSEIWRRRHGTAAADVHKRRVLGEREKVGMKVGGRHA